MYFKMPKNNNNRLSKKGKNNRKRNNIMNDGIKPMGNPFGSGYALKVPNLGAPKRMLATLRQGVQGYLAVGAAATGSAIVYGNSFFEPFTTTTPLTTGWSSFNVTDGSSMTGSFNNASWFTAIFETYRIHSCELSVTSVCGAAGDSINLWFFPAGIAAISAAPTTYQKALGLPGVKKALITAGMRPIKLTSSVKPFQLLGMTKVEYNTNTGTAAGVTSAPTGAEQVGWQVDYATLDGAVTTGQVYFDFDIEIEIEFFNPILLDS
jgi:hypothetical protein